MSLFFRKVKPKPKAQEKKKTVADDPWSCTRCTYINKPMHLSCDMCGSQREFEKKEPEKAKEKEAEFEYVPDITARMETLLETSKFWDVKFIVGEEEKEILCHKVVICRRSPVFAAMFASGFKETRSSEPIRIVDVEAEIFETMIKCMYTDDMDAEDDNVLQLLFCCDKYGFEYGRNECIRQLRQNLTVENAATAYDKLPGLLEDEKYILDFVDENGDEIITQDSFLSLSPKTIHDIVQRDKLQVSESELFNVIRKWAERQCRRESKEATAENLKLILADIIPHIRFPLMTLEEVSDIFRLDLLTKDQSLALFLYLGAEEDKRSEVKVPFVTKERTQNLRRDLIWNKFHRLYMQSSDKKSVTYIGGGTRQHVTAMTKTSMRPGRYRVRLENRGGWTWSIGICTDKHSLETALGRDSESWGFTYMGQLLHNNAERSGYGPSLSQCIVEIVLDAKRRLSFRSYSSNVAPPSAAFTDHGAAYTIAGNAHLYVAVSMDYDSTATLLGYDKDPNGRDWPS